MLEITVSWGEGEWSFDQTFQWGFLISEFNILHSFFQYGYLVIFIEWVTFVCTHCRGASWRVPEEHFPWLVTKVMDNGEKCST